MTFLRRLGSDQLPNRVRTTILKRDQNPLQLSLIHILLCRRVLDVNVDITAVLRKGRAARPAIALQAHRVPELIVVYLGVVDVSKLEELQLHLLEVRVNPVNRLLYRTVIL